MKKLVFCFMTILCMTACTSKGSSEEITTDVDSVEIKNDTIVTDTDSVSIEVVELPDTTCIL